MIYFINFILLEIHAHTFHFVKLNSIIKPFANCTTIMLAFSATKLLLTEATFPIVLFNKEADEKKYNDSKFLERRNFLRRRNPSRHCQTFVLVQPETDHHFHFLWDGKDDPFRPERDTEIYNFFTFSAGFFTPDNYAAQYTILITSMAQEKLTLVLEEVTGMLWLSSHEFISVMIPSNWERTEIEPWKVNSLNLNYFNRYNEFTSWKSLNITCNLSNEVECFQQINSVTSNISRLNKYFWDILPRRGFLSRESVLYNLVYNNHRLIYVEERTIANLSATFYQFLACWIKNTLPGNRSQRVMHYLKFERVLYFFHVNREVIITESKSYNFISCHGVIQHNSVYTSLFSPFDSDVWFTFIVFFVTNCAFLYIITKKKILGFVLLGSSLEISIMDEIILPTSNGVRFIIGIWIVLVGTMLTNWYKSVYTMELIAPFQPYVPWKYVWDIVGFSMYFPFDDITDNVEAYGCGPYTQFNFLSFCNALDDVAGYDGNVTKFKLFRSVANHVWNDYGNCQIPSDLLCRNLKLQDNGSRSELELPFLNALLYRYPLHFVNNLSNCDKMVYLDTNENLDSIIPYINDVSEKTFIKGEVTGFLQMYHGFGMKTVRESYVSATLKTMISSGIHSYWRSWFKNAKKEKLFQHYTNWTGPSYNVVHKLNFSSKIVMGFYLHGILSIVCVLVLVLEWCKYNRNIG